MDMLATSNGRNLQHENHRSRLHRPNNAAIAATLATARDSDRGTGHLRLIVIAAAATVAKKAAASEGRGRGTRHRRLIVAAPKVAVTEAVAAALVATG